MHDHVDRDVQQQRQDDADRAGRKADDYGLGVKDVRYVAVRRADRAQDTDLLRAFEHADIRDDADHDRRNDQGNRHECDQNIADHIDDRRDRTHQQRNDISIGNLVFLRYRAVVILDGRGNAVLILKGRGVNVDHARGIQVDIAELFQRLFIIDFRINRRHRVVIDPKIVLVLQHKQSEVLDKLFVAQFTVQLLHLGGVLFAHLVACHLPDIIEKHVVVHLLKHRGIFRIRFENLFLNVLAGCALQLFIYHLLDIFVAGMAHEFNIELRDRGLVRLLDILTRSLLLAVFRQCFVFRVEKLQSGKDIVFFVFKLFFDEILLFRLSGDILD